MSYNQTKPDQGPSPKLDVGTIQNNFLQFSNFFKINHTALNKIFQGDHEAVILSQQGDPSVIGNETILFCKSANSTAAGLQPELFISIPKFLPNNTDTTNSPNVPIQLTYPTVNVAGPIYQSFLPGMTAPNGTGAYVVYFGVDSGNTVTNVKIVDTITLIPTPGRILVAIAAPNTVTSIGNPTPFDVKTNIIAANQFTINSFGNANGPPIPYSFTWIAICTP
jgi:hypothetical protein